MAHEAAMCGARIVIVDTLGELWRGKIRSEKDADEVSAFLDPYIRKMRAMDVALVLIHHARKDGGGYRGSGALGAKVDVILEMRRPNTAGANGNDGTDEMEDDPEIDDGRRLLEGRGRGVPHFVHRLSFDGQRYTVGEAPMPLADRILAAIPDTGATTRWLRENVRGCSKSISNMVNELITEGAIRRDGTLLVRSGEPPIRSVHGGAQGGAQGGSRGGSRPSAQQAREPGREPPLVPDVDAGTDSEPGWNRLRTTWEPGSGAAVPAGIASTSNAEPVGESELVL